MKTLRSRLLFIFLLFTSLTLLLVLVFYQYDRRKDRFNASIRLLNETQQLLLKGFMVFEDYLTHETVNPDYFALRQSIYLMKHREILRRTFERFDSLENQGTSNSLALTEPLMKLRTKLQHYEVITNNMVEIIEQLGFKDYGLNGKMREAIHQLETFEELDQVKVLMLRRHEKDFMLRGQTEYIGKHQELGRLFEAQIRTRPMDPQRKEAILGYLRAYIQHFADLAQLENRLGLKSNTTLKQQLRSSITEIQFSFDETIAEAEAQNDRILRRMALTLFLFVMAMLIISVVAGFVLSRRVTSKLSEISAHMHRFVESEFSADETLDVEIKGDEVSLLAQNYLTLRHEIMDLISSFKQKVEQRTIEISKQKTRIEHQAAEIMAQRDNLIEKNRMIESQNQSMVDSIRYAERIQSAVLPTAEQLNEVFPENYVLYQPRDIIGGDFYWARRLRSAQQDLSIVAVGDSTGHGVPGALMTMLGYAFLNEIVLRQRIYEAAEILERLRTKIIHSLNYKDEENRAASDGMDMALCVIDHNAMRLQFAGANRPLYMIRHDELIYLPGNSFSVGKLLGSKKSFTQHDLPLELGDQIYLFTDGFADQFGGGNSRKFMRKNIRSLLVEIRNYPFAYQRDLLMEAFERWRGEEKQVDDILSIGLKVS